MPKLLLFAPCERAIVADSNTTSLITLLESLIVNLAVPTDVVLPENLAIPTTWHVVTLWNKQEADIDRRYEQKVQLATPGGSLLLEVTQSFEMTKRNQRNIAVINNFPISGEGEYSLKLLLRDEGENNEWRQVADYPIRIIYSDTDDAKQSTI